MSWLEDYTRGDLDYRRPPGPTLQRLRRFRRRWAGVVGSFLALFVILFTIAAGFILCTLPALPVLVAPPAPQAAPPSTGAEYSQQIHQPDNLKAKP